MKRTTPVQVLLAIVLVLGVLLACKKDDKSSSSSTGSSAEAIGVPECDEYLTKYEKCVKEKVPEAARGQLEQSMKQMRDSWKQLASNPATKAGLAQGCKQALETAKTSMGSYGCEW
jgi:hypothetical protein